MPIHLLWGDDEAARSRAVETLMAERTDPAWQSINLARLDGNDAAQASQALEEARTPPFGGGDRVVVLQRSPFCNQCPAELAEQLEAALPLVPTNCHVVRVSSGKPDAWLRTTKALQVGDALLAGNRAEAEALVDALLLANEPALRIVATLCGQIRGWLWVSLLDQQGESDVNAIAKAAGIGNPKRIYVMRKQIRGRKPARFLALLRQLLDVEAALKRGSDPGDAFRDGFLLTT